MLVGRRKDRQREKQRVRERERERKSARSEQERERESDERKKESLVVANNSRTFDDRIAAEFPIDRIEE